MPTSLPRVLRSSAALSLLLAVSLTVSGCADDDRPPPTPQSTTPGGDATTTPDAQNGEVDLISVIRAGQERVQGSRVVSVEWEDDRRRQGWEVTVATNGGGVELLLAAEDLSEISRRSTRLDRDERDVPAVAAEAAVSTAAAAVPGVAEGISLGRERRRAVWDVDVRAANRLWEVYVDATTGAVVKKERD